MDTVVAIVLAGGQGSRMDVLTRERAKPTLPLAGTFQLIDVPMSNLRNSRIDEVWLAVQYQARMLEESTANGRPWDLDRTYGGFRLLPPQEGASGVHDGFATGNADQLFLLRNEIRECGAQEIIVLSADHVYALDLRTVLATHRKKEAACTMVTVDLGAERGPLETEHHTAVITNRVGRVTDVRHKSDAPSSHVVATEVFVYDAAILVSTLEGLHHELDADGADQDSGLGDFAEHLLPRLVDEGHVHEHRLDGYWRDLGRPSTYLNGHRELAADNHGVLNDEAWPLRTRHDVVAPPRVHAGATFDTSLLGGGCEVHGEVTRSVLGPGVLVEAGARVRDSVLLGDVRVKSGAIVDWSIVDVGTVIETGARVGGPPANPDQVADEEVTLIGADCVVPEGAVLPAGARLEPGTTQESDEPS